MSDKNRNGIKWGSGIFLFLVILRLLSKVLKFSSFNISGSDDLLYFLSSFLGMIPNLIIFICGIILIKIDNFPIKWGILILITQTINIITGTAQIIILQMDTNYFELVSITSSISSFSYLVFAISLLMFSIFLKGKWNSKGEREVNSIIDHYS